MTDNDAIVKRLDVLIRMFLDQQIAEGKSKHQDQILFMNSVGLSSSDIAKIAAVKQHTMTLQFFIIGKKKE